MASIGGSPELWEEEPWAGPLRNREAWGSSNLSWRMESRSLRLLLRMAQGPLLLLMFLLCSLQNDLDDRGPQTPSWVTPPPAVTQAKAR